jgi:hypothetical protein
MDIGVVVAVLVNTTLAIDSMQVCTQ